MSLQTEIIFWTIVYFNGKFKIYFDIDIFQLDKFELRPTGILKGGYNMLTKCKSFADAFIIQTCANNKQLDYATPRSTNCACSAVFKQNRFNSA